MTKSPFVLSKADEIARLEGFIADSGPDGYLRPLLTYLLPGIKTAINNDFVVTDFNPHRLQEQVRALEKSVRDLEAKLTGLRAEEAALNRRCRSDARTLSDTAAELESMARDARKAAAALLAPAG